MNNNLGFGEIHEKQSGKSMSLIIEYLSDKKPHQFNDIKAQTGLSAPTLSKYLKKFVKLNLVTKKIDTISGKYPYPVEYTATTTLEIIANSNKMVEKLIPIIDKMIIEEKNPLKILSLMNNMNSERMFSLLGLFKTSEKRSVEDFDYSWTLIALVPYEKLTKRVIQASTKVIDKIDLEAQTSKLLELMKITSDINR